MAAKTPDGELPTPQRGAIPTPRSEIAASESFQPDPDAKIFVPGGALPTPNHELAAARRFRASGAAPKSSISWPERIGPWGDDSNWAEEAFAKACAEPRVLIPPDVVLSALRKCGSSNFAAFMRTDGFQMDGKAYLDGPFYLVNWTDAEALNGAIANGPVKIGVASANLGSNSQGQVIAGTSGWAIHDLPAGPPEDHWASLFGYGPLTTLVDLFGHNGVNVKLPSSMPPGYCYAMFIWDSVGIIDAQSLMNITGEAWIRNPTTVVKSLGG
jgi:hypothetical protein